MTDLEVHQPASPVLSEQEFGLIFQQAEVLAQSDIIPKAYRGQPANVVVAAITGRSFGWDPIASMRNMHVIEGTATVKPEAMLALVRAAGHSVDGESTHEHATVRGKRADTGDSMEFTFSMADAKAAGLAGKDVWKRYPRSMLWARAVSQLCRMLFPDVLLGLSYVPEEMGAEVSEDGDVVDATIVPPDSPTGYWSTEQTLPHAPQEGSHEASTDVRPSELAIRLDALDKHARGKIEQWLSAPAQGGESFLSIQSWPAALLDAVSAMVDRAIEQTGADAPFGVAEPEKPGPAEAARLKVARDQLRVHAAKNGLDGSDLDALLYIVGDGAELDNASADALEAARRTIDELAEGNILFDPEYAAVTDGHDDGNVTLTFVDGWWTPTHDASEETKKRWLASREFAS